MARPTPLGQRVALHLLAILAISPSANAQTGGCVLVPDDQNPSEKILRCENYTPFT